jgi:CRISPR-associated protein Cas1
LAFEPPFYRSQTEGLLVGLCSPPKTGTRRCLCAENNVALSFLTEHGRFLARVQGPVNGNVLLRREQYRKSDEEPAAASIARAAVMAKVANCRTVVLRGARERTDGDGVSALDEVAGRLARVLTSLEKADTVDAVRGFEGAASVYFSVFDYLITVSKEAFFFRERNRRPPLDNINALLSFLYTLLVHDIEGALEASGDATEVRAVLHAQRRLPRQPEICLMNQGCTLKSLIVVAG